MDNLDIRTVLPLLKQLGINPDNMSPEKIQKLMEIADKVKDPEQINQDTINKLCETLGVVEPNTSVKKQKVPRNSKCPCKSGLKWKKCCGKP
jgi:uncharacterized protein YecA (UPF0149 family)